MIPKIGFNSLSFFEHPIEKAIETIASLNYDAVELWAGRLPWADPHVSPQMNASSRKQLKRQIETSGLQISSLAAHIGLLHEQKSIRDEMVIYTKRCIDLASELTIPIVHIVSGTRLETIPTDKAWDLLLDSIGVCLAHARQNGLKLGIEAVVGMQIGSLEDLARVIKDLEPSKLYVNFDPSHFHVSGNNELKALRDLGERIVHIHIKDAKGHPQEYEFPPLGSGEINFKSLFSELKMMAYKGVLSIEYEGGIFGYPKDPHQAATYGKQFVDRLISETYR